ncbi:BQ2448_5641 [Microbotryum intermedium]|uniref:tRNA N(3)-methylcytidine methyltransferase n=1 Tax=Microbotryum intermedium TaxID=269621 RepID=A0A238F1V3_9BASI|nr:BQ2448_5641 [Microbotryum intermedium]
MASPVLASSSTWTPSSLSAPEADEQQHPPRVRRVGPQLLADELVAEELIAGAPTVKGGRELTTDRDPWTHNAWDKIPWDKEQQQQAQAAIERQKLDAVPSELQQIYNADPAAYWDGFYKNVKGGGQQQQLRGGIMGTDTRSPGIDSPDNFFSDRAWLRNEFPELSDAIRSDAGPKTIVEIGCGPGNTLFPLYSFNENPQLSLHGYDFSKQAVDLVLANPSFNPEHLTSSVWDLASPSGLPPTLAPASVDIAILIFCFSALHPLQWSQAFENLHAMLKPGGVILFRDYGRNDMAQLRFKKGRLMDTFGGLYVRGDGTRVYFFERDELLAIFGRLKEGALATKEENGQANGDGGEPIADSEETNPNPKPIMAPEAIAMRSKDKRFELLQLGVDRRLLLNRKKMIKMYRVWLQGRWRKPLGKEV